VAAIMHSVALAGERSGGVPSRLNLEVFKCTVDSPSR